MYKYLFFGFISLVAANDCQTTNNYCTDSNVQTISSTDDARCIDIKISINGPVGTTLTLTLDETDNGTTELCTSSFYFTNYNSISDQFCPLESRFQQALVLT